MESILSFDDYVDVGFGTCALLSGHELCRCDWPLTQLARIANSQSGHAAHAAAADDEEEEEDDAAASEATRRRLSALLFAFDLDDDDTPTSLPTSAHSGDVSPSWWDTWGVTQVLEVPQVPKGP